MKTQLRLNSVVPHGVSGPEAGAIDLIYAFLLHEFQQDIYSYISINQIGNELNEFVMKEPGKSMHVNIRYPAHDDFEMKSDGEKNRIRLNVIHSGLLRVADYEKKLDVTKLEAIRNKILQHDFSFDLLLKSFINKKKQSLTASIIVHPKMDKFDYFVAIDENGKEKCRALIYKGQTSTFYFEYFFNDGRWKNENEFILTGKQKEVEIHICADPCQVKFVNLTPFLKPPRFEMFKADISKEDKEKARQDWLNSLPPARAANLRKSDN